MAVTTQQAEEWGWGERSAAFAAWLTEVDNILLRHTGLDSGSLPDWRYGDAFDDGMSAEEAAREALGNAIDSDCLPFTVDEFFGEA